MNAWIPARLVAPLRVRRTPSRRVLGFASLAALFFAFYPAVARAQITVEALTGSDTGPYVQDVQDAIKKFSARDIEGARASLESAKKVSPKLAPPEVMLGKMFLVTGQTALGRAELEKAVKKYTDDPEAYSVIAELAYNDGRMTEARLMFLRVLQLVDKFKDNPKRKQTMLNGALATIGLVEEDRTNWKGAREAYRKWVEADPKSPAAHQRYARALFLAGEREEAEKEFKEVNKLDPKTPPVEVALATLYRQEKDNEKADEQIKKAEKNLVSNATGQIAVADWYLASNKFEDAKQHAAAALKLDPQGMEPKLTMGVVARMTKDNDAAEKYLTAAHLASPMNFHPINNLALVLIEKDDELDHKRALEFAVLNSRLNQNNSEAVATLGWINYRMDRLAEAERAFNALVQNNAFSSDSAYFTAMFYQDRKVMADKIIQLLTNTLDGGKPFTYRKEARELLAKLKAQQGKGTLDKGAAAKRPADEKAVP